MKTLVTFLFISAYFLSFGTDQESANNLKTAANASYLSPVEKEIVYEINLFRSNPAEYAEKYIAPLAKNYKGKQFYYPNDYPLMTKEGVRAVDECVRELRKAAPVSILYPNPALTKAANDHVNDQSKTGKTGHYGRDRSLSKQRIERYGNWQERIAENIAYGANSARQIIIYLLIDDGVSDRGHRRNFLRPEFKYVGVATGNHPGYNSMCVMNFAAGITEK